MGDAIVEVNPVWNKFNMEYKISSSNAVGYLQEFVSLNGHLLTEMHLGISRG